MLRVRRLLLLLLLMGSGPGNEALEGGVYGFCLLLGGLAWAVGEKAVGGGGEVKVWLVFVLVLLLLGRSAWVVVARMTVVILVYDVVVLAVLVLVWEVFSFGNDRVTVFLIIVTKLGVYVVGRDGGLAMATSATAGNGRLGDLVRATARSSDGTASTGHGRVL
ncbi:predicted protein [Verticillium alfalfae VaMs.102]|uniref:Predicted protein n=1 Tax=Verticillium alfalfae (strain VaMs.102 / ATCC MYA-4576 / FGSC 10136) TaxID=526221 RepID=C9SP51_VERA1|nr:predicted protein [Verticillium alfalfae VaMs.102]EEY20566.1 predicted protein [Verticillium alfalfae VaMs.102]